MFMPKYISLLRGTLTLGRSSGTTSINSLTIGTDWMGGTLVLDPLTQTKW